MFALNLPAFDHQTKQAGGKWYILDRCRQKWVMLTPEEWVRQHFIHHLLAAGYPQPLLSLERGLRYHGLPRRSDIVAYDRAMRPFLLVECKAPQVPLNEKVLAQALTYNHVLQARYVAITNGLAHCYFERQTEPPAHLPLAALPEFG
ncbi:MAG: type I restriction enzyme HsdR N-terminal domain-containing protein [Bernardetiaceae bacterium]|jgi:hypothetical protein|nr:type I restriction enzyme HsdR N-terminal domain-containing protein [Bernardetiaceae bacterium]